MERNSKRLGRRSDIESGNGIRSRLDGLGDLGGAINGTLVFAVALAALVFWWTRTRIPSPVDPVRTSGGAETVLMDLSQPFDLDPPPAGWRHRRILLRPPMTLSLSELDGRPPLACRNDRSGSIFGRIADIALEYSGDLPHYVAQSGMQSLGRWVDESIDLAALYHRLWRDGEDPKRSFIALFCDTDDTGSSSAAALTRITLAR